VGGVPGLPALGGAVTAAGEVAAASVFVPAGPVWALVRRKQEAWGLDDEAMCDLLDWHPRVVDCRGWMLRSTAERLLRRLAGLDRRSGVELAG
jgi:hypothetical protein